MEIHSITPEDVVLSKTAATAVPVNQIATVFGSDSTDLISKPLGSRILGFSDEWFAAAENLTTPTPPVRKPGVFTYAGAWYDGWETRRHNANPFDWVVIRLGVASGILKGVEIDTAFFDGNHAPEIAVQACFAPSASDADIVAPHFAEWHTVLSRQECGPSRRQAWLLPPGDDKQYTHVRLQMFPDGGIARFRLYGTVVPVLPQSLDEQFDLAAAVNGAVAVACSDQHFGTRHNLLLPGRGVDMGDGWETKRTRGVHIDWTIIKLGVSGRIDRLVIDTAHFRGNFPQKVQVYAAKATSNGAAPAHEDHAAWIQILMPTPSGPDAEHEYSKGQLENVTDQVYGYVKLVIIPDGGVKRIRVFGRRAL